MHPDGKYIYGIIATDEAHNFGPIGVGAKQEVITVGSGGLAAVISNASLAHYDVSHENLMAHARVIEFVAETHTILPMRFCTVAESTAEIIAFLEAQKRELKNLIKDLDGKVEVGIKIIWKDMKKIFMELTAENRTIRDLKKKGSDHSRKALIHAGELVGAALEEKKSIEGNKYLKILKKGPVDYKLGDLKTDDILLNASFLLDRNWLKEFDARVEQFSDRFTNRIEIKYIGPTAPFNFVNLQMRWNDG